MINTLSNAYCEISLVVKAPHRTRALTTRDISQYTSDNIIVSRKKSPTLPENPLRLLGSELERVNCYKYLGVLLTSDLSWSSHVGSICTKARRVLGLLYRRFHGSTSQNSLKQLYLSLVRPHMEYACQVWDPHLAKDKKAIEDVQKFALKVVTSKWDSSYDELLELAKLKPLEERCAELKLGFAI